jgi:hypothetical protein
VSYVNKGDEVYHRADPRKTRSIVIATGAVVVRRIEDGAHVVAAYDPDELKVVGQPTWKRGPLSDGDRSEATDQRYGAHPGFSPTERQAAFVAGVDFGKSQSVATWWKVRPDGSVEPHDLATADPEDSVDIPLEPAGEVFTEFDPARHVYTQGNKVTKGIRAETIDELLQRRRQEDVMPATTGEPGPYDGQPVPERAELDVEDARETLEDAGWFLVSPEGHVTSLGNFKVDSPAFKSIVEHCSGMLYNRGWRMLSPHEIEQGWALMMLGWGDEVRSKAIERAEPEILAAALVDKGWAVVADEDGSRLYPPGQPSPAEDLPEDFAELLRDVATERLTKTELLRRVTGAAPVASCDACHFSVTDDCDLETSTGEGDCQHFEPTWDDVAVALAGYAIQVKTGAREQDERLSIDEAVGRLTVAGYTVVPPGQPAAIGGQPREITEDVQLAIEATLCLACDQWITQTLDGKCGAGQVPDGPGDSCHEWVRTEPAQVRELAHAAVTDLALEEARAVLKEAGYTVVAQSELPDPGCYVCEHWDGAEAEPCQKGMMPGYDDPQPCDRFQHRWQDVAERLSAVVARSHAGEPDEEPQPETDRPPVPIYPTYPTPPDGLEDDTLAAQLDWLRANDLPTGKGSGKKAKTTMVVQLLRFGYYDPKTVEKLTGELQWPPEAARCPVVGEDGEPCGSTEPEKCEHPLPEVPGDGE